MSHPLSKTLGFLLLLLLPAHASDVYFLTRDDELIELSQEFQNAFNSMIISESNRLESKDMPSAFFQPLGKFVTNGEEYSFCLFYVQSRKTGYYYNFSPLLPKDRNHLLNKMRALLNENPHEGRKFNQTDRAGLKELLHNLSLAKTFSPFPVSERTYPPHARQNAEEEEAAKARCYVLSLAADINSATQHGNDEKAIQLAYLVFDHFREHDLLPLIKYGGIDTEGNIVYVRPFPSSFPTLIRRNHQGGIVDYTVDFQAMEKDISHNGVCEHLVIFSPWTDTPLFKIKISKELFIYWVNE